MVHPNWKSTDDESAVRITIQPDNAKGSQQKKSAAQISRSPAAVFGILIALGIGITFFGGVQNLRGALANEQEITISSTGIAPASVEVAPGDEIVWTNQQSIPHILQSSNLCDSSGICLRTETLFENESGRYVIDASIPEGTYTYTSLTDDSITGEIVVLNTQKEQATVTPSVAADIEVLVTDDSINPSTVNAQPGDTIMWRNNASVPHIFSSPTLCTDVCMLTETVEPGQSIQYTVPANAPVGQHIYSSATVPLPVPTVITVQSPGAAATVEPSAEAPTEELVAVDTDFEEIVDVSSVLPDIDFTDSNIAVDFASLQGAAPLAAQNQLAGPVAEPVAEPTQSITPTRALPTNPHTVGSNPLPPVQNYVADFVPPPIPPTQQVPAAFNQAPPAQPATGAGLWFVLLGSVMSILYMHRRLLFTKKALR